MIERFEFSDLRELFAKANEEKSGDQLAGIPARSYNSGSSRNRGCLGESGSRNLLGHIMHKRLPFDLQAGT